MAIKRHISHIKSSGSSLPQASDLVYGEIAVGYGKDIESLYIKNSSDEIVKFNTAAQAQALAELYVDKRVITSVSGDTEISASLSASGDTSGRTLTITHASGSAQSGFKKLDSDTYGHITGGTDVALSDLVGLGAVSGLTGTNGISASTQSNGNVTLTHTNSIAAGTASGTATSTLPHGGSFDIPSVTYDAQGHITATGTTTLTLPNDDNYISGVTNTDEITLGVTNGVLSATHAAHTSGTASGSSGDKTITTANTEISIPSVTFNAQGHATATATTTVNLKVNAASTATQGVVQLANTTGDSTTLVMTQSAVTKAIDDSFTQQDAMRYKGVLSTKEQFESLTNYEVGDTYKVSQGFETTQGTKLEAGDMVIANASGATFAESNFDFIQANLDPNIYAMKDDLDALSATVIDNEEVVASSLNDLNSRKVNNTVTVTGANGLTGGGDLSDNVVISHSSAHASTGQTSPYTNQNAQFGQAFNIPVVQYDTYGHVTATTTTTVTMPGDSNVNYYITGATTTTAASEFNVALVGNNSAAHAEFAVPSATTTAAGVMTSADKTKLNGISSGATKVVLSDAKTAGDTTLATLTIDGTATTIKADDKTLTINAGSTQVVAYSPSTAKTITISGKDSAISVSGSSANAIVIGLEDIECGDF